MYKLFVLSALFLTACSQHEAAPLKSTSVSEIQNIKGMTIYEANCTACHGSDGTGAFAGIPDLTQVTGFRKGKDSDSELFHHIKHVEKGLKTPGSAMAMPAKGGNPDLTEEDIKEVLKYMREKFSNE